MNAKTSELTGVALDWAVAKCEGATDFWFDTVATHWVKLDGKDRALRYGWAQSYLPSTDWAQGGPIIERENIGVTPMTVTVGDDRGKRKWFANHEDKTDFQDGPTALVAAMRCYVASKLGDTVDIPDELTKTEKEQA
jgi:hypothetical protein